MDYLSASSLSSTPTRQQPNGGKMADDRFTPGALVQHTSGGPMMIVVMYGDDSGERKPYCRWLERPGASTASAFFPDAELKVHEPPSWLSLTRRP